MNVLHINSYYPNTDLYRQMLTMLSSHSRHTHIMYVPVPADRDVPYRPIPDSKNARVLYSTDYRYIERWTYNRKRLKIVQAIGAHLELDDVSMVHAHHLFTAGGVAYELKRQYDIPFITAVRNTDINCFFRHAFHLRHFGIDILCQASRIVFISPAGLNGLRPYVPHAIWPEIERKSIVIPNGIDDFWLQNPKERIALIEEDCLTLLYVGSVTRNKNVEAVILTGAELIARGYPVTVLVVGSGPNTERVKRIAEKKRVNVVMTGYVCDKRKLMDLYRSADIFMMPSFTETFGLVYVEAMSQGLPIIYTRGQGIDGFFEDGTIGYACDPRNYSQMADKVLLIRKDYGSISAQCSALARRFSWAHITQVYESIYSQLELS